MVRSEHSLKMSALELLQLGCDIVLKVWRKRVTQLMNELITGMFVEQPRVHRACKETYIYTKNTVRYSNIQQNQEISDIKCSLRNIAV